MVTQRLSINCRMTSLAMKSGYRFELMQSSGMRHIGLKNVLSFPEVIKVIRAIGKIYEDSLASDFSEYNILVAFENFFQQLIDLLSNTIKVNTRGTMIYTA